MIKLILLLLLVALLSFNAWAGKFCAGDLIADHRISMNRNAYDCNCLDGRNKDFRLDTNQVRLGKCRDNYKYKLDIRIFENDVSATRPRLWLDATRFNGLEYLIAPVDTTKIEQFVDLSPTVGLGANAVSVGNSIYPLLLPTDQCRALMCGYPRISVFYSNAAGNVSRGVGTFAIPLNLNNMTFFIVYKNVAPAGFAQTIFTLLNSLGNIVLELEQSTDSVVSVKFPTLTLSTSSTPNTISAVDPVYTGATPPQDNIKLVVLRNNNRNLEFYVNPYHQTYDINQSPSRQGRQNFHDITYPDTQNIDNISNYIIASASNPAPNVVGLRPFEWLHIHEIILFDRALTHGERREIEFYLRRKWGITYNLPTQ